MRSTELSQLSYAGCIVAEAPDLPQRLDMSVEAFETSIPQMVLFTVTCLVRTIGAKRLFGRA
jgi:hypothetical protein